MVINYVIRLLEEEDNRRRRGGFATKAGIGLGLLGAGAAAGAHFAKRSGRKKAFSQLMRAGRKISASDAHYKAVQGTLGKAIQHIRRLKPDSKYLPRKK